MCLGALLAPRSNGTPLMLRIPVLDPLAQHNQQRWEALAQAGVEFSRPWLDLTPKDARQKLDPEGMMGDVAGREVLCLTASGGQQSAAFCLLGASVTVLDFCETQLARDHQAAAHYGFQVTTLYADMRDFSAFADDSFDLVWHAHSLNFIPSTREVFDGVARTLRPDGLYRLETWNPFAMGVDSDGWDGTAYPLKLPYDDGAEVVWPDPHWDFEDAAGQRQRVEGPREFRHSLSTLVNALLQRRFTLLGLWERPAGDPAAEPGTWAHFERFAPPWLALWAKASG
jgi:SAM-dependent methyltransferase